MGLMWEALQGFIANQIPQVRFPATEMRDREKIDAG